MSAAALKLHAAVHEWSSQIHNIFAAIKRMTVLIARLSDAMNTDDMRLLIFTLMSTVNEAAGVTKLARRLALECTDVRIRTNLLQVCDRISTISGQLKMLTNVKEPYLRCEDGADDLEAIRTLFGNIHNLMMTVQEIITAAVSASLKIPFQRNVE